MCIIYIYIYVYICVLICVYYIYINVYYIRVFHIVFTDVTRPSYVHVWPGKLAKSVFGIIQVVS